MFWAKVSIKEMFNNLYMALSVPEKIYIETLQAIFSNKIEYEKYNIEVLNDGQIQFKSKETQKIHRDDGPAIVYTDGRFSYWLRGKRHREDGPAEISYNGKEYYYLNGKELSKTDFDNNKYQTTEIDGQKYKLIPID